MSVIPGHFAYGYRPDPSEDIKYIVSVPNVDMKKTVQVGYEMHWREYRGGLALYCPTGKSAGYPNEFLVPIPEVLIDALKQPLNIHVKDKGDNTASVLSYQLSHKYLFLNMLLRGAAAEDRHSIDYLTFISYFIDDEYELIESREANAYRDYVTGRTPATLANHDRRASHEAMRKAFS